MDPDVATVEGNPVALQELSLPANLRQLTLQATQMQPPPLPPPDVQQPAPPPPLSPRGQNNDGMIAGKAPLLGKFSGDRDELKGWILQMEDYFIVTTIQNPGQQLSFISMCLPGTGLVWWKNKKFAFHTWKEGQDSLRYYYRDHYKPARCYCYDEATICIGIL